MLPDAGAGTAVADKMAALARVPLRKRAGFRATALQLHRTSSQDFGESVANGFSKQGWNRIANLFDDLRAIPSELEIIVKGL